MNLSFSFGYGMRFKIAFAMDLKPMGALLVWSVLLPLVLSFYKKRRSAISSYEPIPTPKSQAPGSQVPTPRQYLESWSLAPNFYYTIFSSQAKITSGR